MPKATFTTDHVKRSATDFPRVKLGQNETWRLVVIEKEPTFAWTHRLQKPKFSPVSGAMLMKTIKRRSGEEISVPDLEWVGSPACFGNLDALAEKGIDVDHCPMCKQAHENPEQFSAPERRFAVHVLKYATRQGTSQLTSPFSVETRVWIMSENRFAQVVAKITEFGGDPTRVDLILGPCINASFQNYEIGVGQNCEMRADADRMKRAADTFKENNAGDLEPYCGIVKERRWVESDIEDVITAWRKASLGGSAPAPVDVSGTLDSTLLDSVSSPKSPPAADLSQLDDTVGSKGGSGLDEFAPVEPIQQKKPKSDAPASADIDFDALLDGI
jgi:hypothetical protein